MSDSRRATGRSFRVMMNALAEASEGNFVIVICQHANAANHMFNRMIQVVNSCLVGAVISSRTRTIRFPFKRTGAVKCVSSYVFISDYHNGRYAGIRDISFKYDDDLG